MAIFSSLYGTRLDRELGTDDSTVLFTTARRKSAINEAQEQFADLTDCTERRSSITVVAGTSEYNLASTTVIVDFVRFTKEQVQYRYTDASSNLTVLAGDDLPRKDVPWLNRFAAGWQISTQASSIVQHPSYYYERIDGPSRFLGVTPPPGIGSSATADLLVPYLARPAAMTSDTNEPFMVNSSVRTDLRIYHQALVHYAASQLEKLRKDDQASDRQMQLFLGYVKRYMEGARTKGGQMLAYARDYFQVRS